MFKELSAEKSDDDIARLLQTQKEKQASIEEIQDLSAQNQRPTTPLPVIKITLSAVMQLLPPIDKDEDSVTGTEVEPTESKRSSYLATKPKLDYAKMNIRYIQMQKKPHKEPTENFILLETISSKTKSDPEIIKEVLAQPEANKWYKVIDNKLKQHQDSEMFRLEHLLLGQRMIGWYMVFQTKQDKNSNILKCKA